MIAARRQGVPAKISASRVRAHLKKLVIAGVGSRQVAHATGVARSHVQALHRAKVVNVNVARKILRVEIPKGDGVIVSTYKTRKMIAALLSEGWTLHSIARRLRMRSTIYKAMATEGFIRLRTERVVEKLYRSLMGEVWDG